MNDFYVKEAKNIAWKLSTIRKKLNIPVNKLESALFISKGTIANIEAGHAAKLEAVVLMGYFFGMTLMELADQSALVFHEPELRERIRKFHSLNGIKDSEGLLELEPTIKTVLTDRLIAHGYMDEPISIEDIIALCNSKYKLKYVKRSVERVLKELIDERLIKYLQARDSYIRVDKL